MKHANRVLLALCASVGIGCGAADREAPGGADAGGSAGGAAAGPSGTAPDGADPVPPAATRGGAACVFSLDCPAGTHCDLGECVQRCSADEPCAAGSCSPRGRCVAAGATDDEPASVTGQLGTVTAERVAFRLTDQDDRLRIRLHSDSAGPVRYRIAASAPFLDVPEPRGEFTSDTVLELPVSTATVDGGSAVGSVHVYTTLGDVVVNVAIDVGIGGSYEGTLRYEASDAAHTSLGSAGVGLDLEEEQGRVRVRVDPTRSVTFPEALPGEAVTGTGAFTVSGGATFTVRQVLPAGFIGDADPFQRSVGREVTFRLAVGQRGALEGTFEETVHGLFGAPVVVAGTVHLERRPCPDGRRCAAPIPEPGGPVALPAPDPRVPPDVAAIFPGWTDDSCALQALAYAATCTTRRDCADALDAHYYEPFAARAAGTAPLGGASTPTDLPGDCARELAATTPLAAPACGQTAPLACALEGTRQGGEAESDLFVRFYGHVAAPPLLVARDAIAGALRESFLAGPSHERARLEGARRVLVPPTRWLLHPAMLDHLQRLGDRPSAAGDEPLAFDAGRALGRTFHVMSAIDRELGRLRAAVPSLDPEAARREIQRRGVAALLEAATISGLAEAWGGLPPDLSLELVDVLTQVDAGFTALRQGALALGVPPGVVQNVFEPGREPTNFEQLLAMATSRIDEAEVDEAAFSTNARAAEQDAEALAAELDQLAGTWDLTIRGACGDSIDVETPDWDACGADGHGTVGARLLATDQAVARLASAKGRIDGVAQRVQIETERVAAVAKIRADAVAFTAANGSELRAVLLTQGAVRIAEKTIEIASQASIANLGFPLGEAAGMGVLEAMNVALDARRADLELAQELRTQEDAAQVEQLNGMATVRGLLVDLAQQNLELQEAAIGVQQARMDAESALAEAKRAHRERRRVLARLSGSTHRDPSFRVLATRAAVNAVSSRAAAQTALLRAARGLEYHLNQTLGAPLDQAALNAYSAAEARRMSSCLRSIFDESRTVLPRVESYVTDVSLRRLLGVQGPRTDEVTGRVLDEGEQFRLLLLRNENLDGEGGVSVELSSTLDQHDGPWSGSVCDDRITLVQAQLVGDFQGDGQAEVRVELQDGGVLSSCTGEGVTSWSTSGRAIVQAGVNGWGDAPANGSLRALPVASSRYRITIPGAASAPSNADLDLTAISDVVLRVHHEARPTPDAPAGPVPFECLSRIGTGG